MFSGAIERETSGMKWVKKQFTFALHLFACVTKVCEPVQFWKKYITEDSALLAWLHQE